MLYSGFSFSLSVCLLLRVCDNMLSEALRFVSCRCCSLCFGDCAVTWLQLPLTFLCNPHSVEKQVIRGAWHKPTHRLSSVWRWSYWIKITSWSLDWIFLHLLFLSVCPFSSASDRRFFSDLPYPCFSSSFLQKPQEQCSKGGWILMPWLWEICW